MKKFFFWVVNRKHNQHYVVRCAIWYHLYNFKNAKNTYGGVLILVKLQATKINTPPWLFFTFFKLHKCYQIAQPIKYLIFLDKLDFFVGLLCSFQRTSTFLTVPSLSL